MEKYTRKQAADILGVSVVTLDRWRKARIIGYNQVGKKVTFFQKHIDNYYQATEVKAQY
jgi:predicted site-specific integrase-resolvase